jgi:TolB-like protein
MMRINSPWIRPGSVLPLFLLLVGSSGCSYFSSAPKLEEQIDLIAVMPIEREEPNPDDPTRKGWLAPGAERVVTAQVYWVLSSSSEWRFVPDLTVTQALAKVPRSGDLATRARALGREVGADAVIFGTVSRYEERVGTEYGAIEPAAAAFSLKLVSVATGKILWSGSFDQQQRALSENLLNWWQFWRGGPRWFSAQEFTRLGVEQLMDNMAAHMD